MQNVAIWVNFALAWDFISLNHLPCSGSTAGVLTGSGEFGGVPGILALLDDPQRPKIPFLTELFSRPKQPCLFLCAKFCYLTWFCFSLRFNKFKKLFTLFRLYSGCSNRFWGIWRCPRNFGLAWWSPTAKNSFLNWSWSTAIFSFFFILLFYNWKNIEKDWSIIL